MSNVTLNAGAGGATLGTDLVGGIDYQLVKVTFSTAGSTPTQVDATHQLPVLCTQTGTWNITNVSGTVSLPTGAATAAKQPALGTAGSASADVISIQGIASMTPVKVDGSGVTQPVSGTVAATQSGAWSLSANQSVNVSQINGVTPLMGNGATGTGAIRVSIANDSTGVVQPGNTANTTPWLVTDTPGTSGGLSFSYVLSAANSNLTQAKGSAGQLFTIVVTNTNAAARYLKIFNKASASVTMGTTAADFQIVIPGNTAGAGIAINIDKGITMGTGISFALTAGVSLTDNTSVAANEVSALIGYK